MKIGIISDIHAYLEPLQKALTIFDTAGVDRIVCAGDLVDGGEDGDAVVRLIQERSIDCVLGNHDGDAFRDQAFLRKRLRQMQEITSRVLLDSQTVAYVSSLPLNRFYEWEGYRVCLAHGTPTSNAFYLFPKSPVQRFQEAVEAAQCDMIILGHTHVPMKIHFRNTWILNPGSLCYNRFDDENRTCAILTLPELNFEVWDVDTGKQFQT